MSEADSLELRASLILREMYELKSFCEMEIQFKEIAEKNDKMRELWSEYALLKGYGVKADLPSAKEYLDMRNRLAIVSEASNEWTAPLFACAKCGGGVRRKEDYILTSFPPRYLYKCDKCGMQDTHV